jgi:transposase
LGWLKNGSAVLPAPGREWLNRELPWPQVGLPPRCLLSAPEKGARTQTINRLHRLLMDLVPGRPSRNLTANRAAVLLAAVTPAGAPAVTRWQLATELVADVRQLEQRIAAVETRIKAAVVQANTSLVRLFGVGPVLAARFLGEVGDVGRFPTKHHFRRPHRHRAAGGLWRPGHPPPAVPGR